MNTQHITIETEEEAGLRLDKLLATRLPELSRTRIQSLLEEGQVRNAETGLVQNSGSSKVRLGQSFLIEVPPPQDSTIKAVDIPLDIIYEDDDLLVINKPAGMTVHPAPGHHDDTLVNALLAHCKDSLSGIGGVARPGIVHRIDKDTSGLLVVAKHDAAHAHLSDQLKKRTLKRTYIAICWGVPKYAEGTIEGDIGRHKHERVKMSVVKEGGKPATTHYTMLESYSCNIDSARHKGTLERHSLASLVECELETGRTHQIRVHFAHEGYALVGDPLYAPETAYRIRGAIGRALPEETRETLLSFNRQALHAAKLMLRHPGTFEEMEFEAPLPEDLEVLIEALQLVNQP